MEERRLGIVLGVGAYVVWGFLTVYWKTLHGLDAFELIGVRVLSSFAILAVVLSLTHRWGGLRPLRQDRALLARITLAAVLLTANWTSYVWAVVHDNVIETALGYFIAPLVTVLLGVVALGERLRPAQRVALGLATVAVVVLTLAYGRVPVIAIVIAVSWSWYALLKRRVPLAPLESLTGECAVLLLPSILVLALPALAGSGLSHDASTAQLWLLPLAGLATTVPLLMFAGAARRLPLTVLGPIQYAVPTINFLLGALVYHEDLDAARMLGFGLVWIGLIVFSVDGVLQARRPSNPAEAATVAS